MAQPETQSPSPPELIECKYDHISNDIFIYLTKRGLLRLRNDPNGNHVVSVVHKETGAHFDVINNVSNKNGDIGSR